MDYILPIYRYHRPITGNGYSKTLNYRTGGELAIRGVELAIQGSHRGAIRRGELAIQGNFTFLSRNSLVLGFQTSQYHHFNWNFEPDPFFRSRRLQNGQNRPETAFFNKKLIFVESAPVRILSIYRRPGLGPGPRPFLFHFNRYIWSQGTTYPPVMLAV